MNPGDEPTQRVEEVHPTELWESLSACRAYLTKKTAKEWDPEASALLNRLAQIIEEGLDEF